MTAAPRGAGSPPIVNSTAYPLWQFDVSKDGVGRYQFWVSSYAGNPYNPTESTVVTPIVDKFIAMGFTINSVQLYQEYTDPSVY